MLYNKMGQSVIQLMRYDATKASSSSGSDNHQSSTLRPLGLPPTDDVFVMCMRRAC